MGGCVFSTELVGAMVSNAGGLREATNRKRCLGQNSNGLEPILMSTSFVIMSKSRSNANLNIFSDFDAPVTACSIRPSEVGAVIKIHKMQSIVTIPPGKVQQG